MYIAKLIENMGGIIVGYAFAIELVELKGREKLKHPVYSLIEFEGH